MKYSKIFLLVLFTVLLALAVSACVSSSGGSELAGKTLPATITSIDGNKVTLSVTYTSGTFNTIQQNVSMQTGTKENESILQGSVQYNSYTQNVTFPNFASAQGAASAQSYATIQLLGSIGSGISFHTKIVTTTVGDEMLAELAVGDSVYVTFDENENVIKIEKRESTEGDENADEGGASTTDSTKSTYAPITFN